MIYKRKTYYHETDQMKVIHHANYLKYLEEARIYYLDNIGVSYKMLEDIGIVSPVLEIECRYKKSILFDEIININIIMTVVTPVKFEFEYEIINSNNEICFTGHSKHCLLKDGKVISIKKENINWYNLLLENVNKA